jgi:hypothetical protein
MHPLLPAILVFVLVFLFVVEFALAGVLLVTAFAVIRAWLVDAVASPSM